jgi:isoquinoline 1-oxidoreductase subunit alpha
MVSVTAGRVVIMMNLKINGENRTFDAPADMPLLWVLRDVLGMTGTKFGCGIAQCGACTVHIDGKPVRSCLLPVGAIGNRAVTTIALAPLQPERRCRRHGWTWKLSSAVIASRVRSCRQPHYSR